MRRSLSLLVAVLFAASCASVTKYQPKGALVPYQGFHAKLPSGMQVVVYEVPQIERFTLTVSYGSGSAEDPAGKEGLAHLVEHLAFRTVPEGSRGTIWDALTAAGWRFNATTGPAATDYYELGKAVELRDALRLEASRMRAPLAGVDEKAFEVERAVVLAEWRERFDTDRQGAQVEWLQQDAFASHPYGRPVRGTPEGLRASSLADARAWAAERYVPQNAIMVVVSPYGSREVMRHVLESFEELAVPGGPERPPRVVPTPPLPVDPGDAPETAVRKAPVRQPTVWVAWPVPGAAARRDAQGVAAAAALQKAFPGVLLRRYGPLAFTKVESWSASYVPVGGDGLVTLTATLGDGNADEAIDLARSAALELVLDDDQGYDDPLTVRARKLTVVETRDQLLVDNYVELEQIRGPVVAAFLRATGEPDYLASRQKTIAATLNSDISSYAHEFLRRSRSVAQVVVPDANATAAGLLGGGRAGGAGDRNDLEDGAWEPPEPELVGAVARSPGLGRAARRVLQNGMTAVVLKRGELPVAEVSLVLGPFVAGTDALPAGGPAFALATNDARFARVEAARVGAAWGLEVGPETVRYTTHGSPSNLEVLLESTSQWVRDQKVRYMAEVEDAYLRKVERWEHQPEVVAGAALLSGLYPGHPYSAIPRAEALKRAGEPALEAFLRVVFRPDRATLFVVSNQPESPELWASIERHFGGWRRGSAPRAEPPEPPAQVRRVVLVHRRGASQALLGVGLRVPALAGRDRPATEALAWLIENRLVRTLRIAEGVTWGARVDLQDQQRAGALIVSTAVDRDAAAHGLSEILAAAAVLAKDGVSPSDAGRARWQVARRYATAFDTVGESAAELVQLATYGLPFDAADADAESIRTLDAARIKAAAALLPLGRESVVIVGDAEVLLPQLQAAGFAPEVVRP